MMEITCVNCGKQIEVTTFKSFVFCPACNSKLEVKREINFEQQNINRDNYLKAKANLHEAYVGRKIDNIVSAVKDVLRIVPDDFFARFLYAFCESQRGNDNYLLSFFEKCDINNSSQEEINIVLKEITVSTSLHKEKCEFMNMIEERGLDITDYYFYLDKLKEEQQGKDKKMINDMEKRINLQTLIFSMLMSFIMLFVFASSENLLSIYSGLLPLILIYLIINQIIVSKKGYEQVLFFISLTISLGIYPFVRWFVVLVNYLMYRNIYNIKLKGLYFYRR